MREFRLSYSSPCQTDGLGKLGNVYGCIAVAVRHVSTIRTRKFMLDAFPNISTYRTRLARICGVNKNHGQSSALRLVADKVLQLPESPPMQTSSDTFPRFDVDSDISQVFHSDFTSTRADCFCNDRLAYFVVDMLHMSAFTTGDSLELAFSSSATVGLETTTMGKIFIAVMPQLSATPDLAGTGCCEVVFTDINPANTAPIYGGYIRDVKTEIKVPNSFTGNKFRFFGRTACKQVALMFATNESNMLTPTKRKQGKRIALNRINTFVKIDRRRFEGNRRNRFILGDAFVGLEHLIGICNAMDSLANHLATKFRKFLTNHIVGEVMQGNTVPASMLLSKRNNGITRRREHNSQVPKGLCLFGNM